MIVIPGEVWLHLTDGRLISLHRVAAETWVATGEAVVIPPERVVENEAGTGFVLLPAPAPAETAMLAPARTAMRPRARARKAAG